MKLNLNRRQGGSERKHLLMSVRRSCLLCAKSFFFACVSVQMFDHACQLEICLANLEEFQQSGRL